MAKILVADDNSNIQKMVALALKDQGIEVVAVGNGEAAVRRLPALRPDLVLADIFMPVRNGYEVCEFVKHDSQLAHIPVILLVGAFDPLDEQEAQRVGADGVLKKPFIPPDPLITLVKSALAKSGIDLSASAPLSAPEPVPTPPSVMPRVAASVPASVNSQAQAAEPETEPEPFAVQPERIAFDEREKPLAFGELLETPGVEAEPEATRTSSADSEESKFWHGPPPAEEVEAKGESEAREWVRPERVSPWAQEPVVEEGAEIEAGLSPEIVTDEEAPTPSLEVAPPPDLATSADDWLSSAPAQPPAGLSPEASESWDTTARSPVGSAPGTPEPWGSAWEQPGQQASTPSAMPWPGEKPPMEEKKSPTPWVDAAPSSAAQSFPAPAPPDPHVIEAVASKVLERMQPQIVELVTREILKPVVEALVRRELERQKTEVKP